LSLLKLAIITSGSSTSMVKVVSQEYKSETVTLYVPAVKLDAVAVV